jgi:hypothetical protein
VRTGKRYGKTSLTARHSRDLARAIAECRYLLRNPDPDGALVAAGRVGQITHKDRERASPVRWATRRSARAISPVCAAATRSRRAASCSWWVRCGGTRAGRAAGAGVRPGRVLFGDQQ